MPGVDRNCVGFGYLAGQPVLASGRKGTVAQRDQYRRRHVDIPDPACRVEPGDLGDGAGYRTRAGGAELVEQPLGNAECTLGYRRCLFIRGPPRWRTERVDKRREYPGGQCGTTSRTTRCPARFAVLDELPRNITGKVVRRELLARADAVPLGADRSGPGKAPATGSGR